MMMMEHLEDPEAFLERMQAKDRARAEEKRQTRPATLTDYELRLLGLSRCDVTPKRKSQSATESPARLHFAIYTALRPKGIQWRTPELERLNKHAIELCVEHGIRVVRDYKRARAGQEARTIYCEPVTDEVTYGTCLHEIAHCVDPEADSRQFTHHVTDDNSLISPRAEINAWRWAKNHARTWTRAMQDDMFKCLGSYAHGADEDSRFHMSALFADAAFHIADQPMTVGELNQKCAELRGEHVR